MAVTGAAKAKLEKQAVALAETESKSAGLRLLFENDYTIIEAREAFGEGGIEIPYGFAYGVAKRAGVVEQAAERRGDGSKTAERKAKTAPAKPAAKAAKPAAKVAVAKPAPRAKAAPAKTATKATTRAKA